MTTARLRITPDKMLFPNEKSFDIHLRTKTEGYIWKSTSIEWSCLPGILSENQGSVQLVTQRVNWIDLYIKGAGSTYVHLSGIWCSWPLGKTGRGGVYYRGTTSFVHCEVVAEWRLDYLT